MVHILGFRERERVAGGDDGLVLASRLMGDPSHMIFDPAWKTVVWKASELDVGGVWTGTPVPDSFWSYGTPLAAELPHLPAKKPLLTDRRHLHYAHHEIASEGSLDP